jgi:hypothetical protein
LATAVVLLLSAPAAAQFTSRPECMDGVDNDVPPDGLVDYSVVPGQGDPGCDAWNDDDELDVSLSTAIRARLAIAFDTSGSMINNVCTDGSSDGEGSPSTFGDGSLECPGIDVDCCREPPGPPRQCRRGGEDIDEDCDSPTCNNDLPDDSRMFKVKQGVADAVRAYGEIEFSLYRFYADDAAFDCPEGGWRGLGDEECEDDGRADRLVKFAPENQEFILQWMDNETNWDGAGDPPAGMDIELRGTGFTPLGDTLNQIRNDIQATRATDPDAGCRPYNVVLVTDGQETCGGNPVTAADRLLDNNVRTYVIGFAGRGGFVNDMNDIAEAGGTGEAYFADSPEALSAALADIVARTALVEVCDGDDDDCDGVIDNGFDKGPCDNGLLGTCFAQGTMICDGPTTTVCDAPQIQGRDEVPLGCNGLDDDCDGVIDNGLTCAGCGSEICNGIDDDCDGVADDGDLPGEGEPCQLDEGECQAGTLACTGGRLVCEGYIGPSPEVCDNLDNNCDGVTDLIVRSCFTGSTGCIDGDPSPNGFDWECEGVCRPGTQTCTAGVFGSCGGQVVPTPELCNGRDDDCDGDIDEGFEDRGEPCERGTGLCRATGELRCTADGSGLECDAPVVSGGVEVCNLVDDDCDGTVDDLPTPPPPPIGRPCGTCGGVFQCSPESGLVCSGGNANPETCNGEDDDCNGIVDDGVLPGVGDACVPEPPFMVTGECRAGRNECIGGELQCVGFAGPNPEVCNGRDDDCDGNRDDMAACPSPNDACHEARCVSPCGEGEFPCPFGLYCKQLDAGRFCIPDPCAGTTCAPGTVCDRESGECVDPCEGVTCPGASVCREGRCVDCFTLGCPQGMLCISGQDGIGACTSDRCAGVTCPEGQACRDGDCVAVACPGGCPAGQVCEANQCVGECSAARCGVAPCAVGTVCNPATGRCIADPCAGANCGRTSCSVSCDGQAVCAAFETVEVLATGSGGFSCEIALVSRRSPPALLALLALAALLSLRRRRR